jgi:hypothetical protein
MKNETKLSLDILRSIDNTITVNGNTFSPIRELIYLHLVRCRHSEQYITEAFIKPIESRIGGSRTKLSDYVFFKLWNNQNIFMMNLLRMSDQPHWLYAKLEEWGFDLRDRVDHTLEPIDLSK